MRITAKKTVFYGWEFYYRFESSAKGKTIALSLRENDNVIYEHKRIVPARLKELSDENIANEMLPRFIVDLFTSDKRNPDVKEKMAERRKSVPLGIAWILDRERLIVKREWANKTIKEYDYIANKMIALWGEKNIQDIKPWDCEWKKNGFGERDEKCAVRFMTILCTQEIAGGYLKEDIWENYQHNTPRKKRSQQSSIRANIENRELTDGQCTQIVQSCMTMIEKDDRNKELYYASLLLLLMGMDISELCALSYSSIRPLEHYKNRYTLLVKDTFQRREGKQNCTLQRIENPYQIRILPCSTVVSYATEKMISAFEARYGDRAKKIDYPILGNKKNMQRNKSPQEFFEWFCKEYGDVFNKSRVMPDRNRLSASEIAAMMKNTTEANLMKYGGEEGEIRYFFGKNPINTSTIHYLDFTNEAQLNRIGAIQDRWHKKLYPVNENLDEWNERGKKLFAWQNPTPGMGGDVDIHIMINKPRIEPSEDFIFCLISKCGMEYRAKYIESKAEGECVQHEQ